MKKKTKQPNNSFFDDNFFKEIAPSQDKQPEKKAAAHEPDRIFSLRYLENLKAIPPERYSFNCYLMKRIIATLASKLQQLEKKATGEKTDPVICEGYHAFKPVVVEMAEKARALESQINDSMSHK
jgi:hypothetical protein